MTASERASHADLLAVMRRSHASLLRCALIHREYEQEADAEKLEDAAAEIRADIRHHERRAFAEMVVRT